MSVPGLKKALRMTVEGTVQGVGFRYSTLRKAESLGLTGYVRNCFDGKVEVVAEGEDNRIDQLKRWLKKGPPGAYVRNIEVREGQYRGLYPRFSIEF